MQSMYLQPGHAGCVISIVFFNARYGSCLMTPVANNDRDHLLAKLAFQLLYVAIFYMRRFINHSSEFCQQNQLHRVQAGLKKPTLNFPKCYNNKSL